MKSNDWLKRQKKDPFVINAQKKGYLSRAAFKLLEIDNKYKLISKSKIILELGSSPGGWSQVLVEKNKDATIYAFDLINMKYSNQNIKFYKVDFENFDYSKLVHKFDLIVSDLAPNTTGHKSTDHLRMISLLNNIILMLQHIAGESSSLIIKIWKGSEENIILRKLKKKYKKVNYFKPKSSRKESSEIFIIAQKYRD